MPSIALPAFPLVSKRALVMFALVIISNDPTKSKVMVVALEKHCGRGLLRGQLMPGVS